MTSLTASGTLLATARRSSLAATTFAVAIATAAGADALAPESAEAVPLVHAAISVIVDATLAAARAAAGRTLCCFVGSLVHVLVTIAHATVAACGSDAVTSEQVGFSSLRVGALANLSAARSCK
jgi:hypothetical protein